MGQENNSRDMPQSSHSKLQSDATTVLLSCLLFFLAAACACEVERRKSDAELGLNPQQASGRHIYDQYCDRCHAPYSSGGRKGPSLKGVFKRQYLSMSGMPANDDRVADIIRLGRNNMEGFGQVLTQDQINDLLAYLHTL
jgi:mono/diheme cytochrome c family protein